MTYKNETERNVMYQLSSNTWKRALRENPNIELEFYKSSEHTYAIYNHGSHTGTFINSVFINPDEAKELGWKIHNVIKDNIDPFALLEEQSKERNLKKSRKHKVKQNKINKQ